MLSEHLEGLLNYFEHAITNAMSEGFMGNKEHWTQRSLSDTHDQKAIRHHCEAKGFLLVSLKNTIVLKNNTMNHLTTLFPAARAEIIRLLFADSNHSFHLRELARLGKLTTGALQAEVNKLKGISLLLEKRDGNRLYFSANPEHPLYPELHGIALKTTGMDAQLAQALDGLPGITLAFVFGSFANDNAGPQSDVDLFIAGAIGLRQIAPRLRAVADALGREINPYVTTPAALAKKIKSKDTFILNILKSPKRWIIGNDHELENLAN